MSFRTTMEFPQPFVPVKRGQHWYLEAGDREVKLSNLPKVFYPRTGFTKGDLLAAYYNLAPTLLPYLHDRPLTLRRMPDGAEGDEFYEKQAPAHTPDWVPRAYIEGHGRKGATDFLMAQDVASLLYVVNLGCIEMHPMHARQTSFDRPDYAFFDLDPFPPIEFSTVRAVARMVGVALESLGLTGYPKISGATGIVVYVPLDGSHTYEEARAFVERVCRIVNRANPEQTTMAWEVAKRAGKVFLDFAMVSEGRNIASVYSVRPTPTATVGVPVAWDELDTDVTPEDFTIATVWDRLARVGDLFEPMRAAGTPAGHNLSDAAAKVGLDLASLRPPPQDAPPPPAALQEYKAKRSFTVTPEPEGRVAMSPAGNFFMIHKHHARRLHYDLRLERGGVLVSYAVPRGLPEVPNERRLAVHVEDHPFEYGSFEGTIPKGEYGAGEARIYDSGTYDAVEWLDDKLTIRLHGERVWGEYHLVQTDGKNWLIFRSARDVPMPEPNAPPSIEPMLATLTKQPFDDPDWVFEPKWDGVRTLAFIRSGSLKLLSRRKRDVTELYPELGPMAEQLAARNGLVDGEVVAFDGETPSFERIQSRFTQTKPSSRLLKTTPVDFLAFDLLWLDGESLMDRTLEERRALLERLLVPAARIQISPQIPEAGVAFFEVAEQRGLEGIVAKRRGSIYRPGQRSRDWLKVKAVKTLDVVILGWTPGQGARDGSLGSIVAGIYRGGRLAYAGHVGTGFTDRLATQLVERLAPLETAEPAIPIPPADEVDTSAARWSRPELVCEVEYLQFTSQGRMRAASFKRLREDKVPSECVVEA
ncbi:MAG TPA: non-homologous end-joining DNA ligase [Actinomycetota bacterium]